MSTATNPVAVAILSQKHVGRRVMLAELLATGLEGGWGPTFSPGDEGTSFGPYQIHLPAHPGVSQSQANDPVWSTAYMRGAFKGAVHRVAAALWKTNPEAAAEQAAFYAERPNLDYVASRGKATVDDRYTNAVQAFAATGKRAPGLTKIDMSKIKNDGSGLHLDSNPLNDAKALATAGVGAAASATANAFGDVVTTILGGPVKEGAMYVGFAGVGLVLVVGGLLSLTKGARQKVTSDGGDVLAATGGGGGAGKAAAGGSAAALPPEAALAL